MKYFIRKRKDCISSFFACRGIEKEWRRGIKKNVFFGNYCVCVCVTNGGEMLGLGVGGRGRWKKCQKRRHCVEGDREEILKEWSYRC